MSKTILLITFRKPRKKPEGLVESGALANDFCHG